MVKYLINFYIVVFFITCNLYSQDYKLENRVLIPDSIIHKFIKIYEFPFSADPIEFQTPYFSFIEKTEKGYQLWNMDYNSMQLYCYDLVNQKITIYGNGKGKGPGELLYPPSLPSVLDNKVIIPDKNQYKIIVYDRDDIEYFNEYKVKYSTLNVISNSNSYYVINKTFPKDRFIIEYDSSFIVKKKYGDNLIYDIGPIKLSGVLDSVNGVKYYLHYYPIRLTFNEDGSYNINSYHNFDRDIPNQDLIYDNNRSGNTFTSNYSIYYDYVGSESGNVGIICKYWDEGKVFFDCYSDKMIYKFSIDIQNSFYNRIKDFLDIDKNEDIFYTLEDFNRYKFVLNIKTNRIAILDMFECAKYYQAHYQNSK